jgi:hypothetical protein
MLYISAGAILGMPHEFSGWAPGLAWLPPGHPARICRQTNWKKARPWELAHFPDDPVPEMRKNMGFIYLNRH